MARRKIKKIKIKMNKNSVTKANTWQRDKANIHDFYIYLGLYNIIFGERG